jgi:hypothetical protein
MSVTKNFHIPLATVEYGGDLPKPLNNWRYKMDTPMMSTLYAAATEALVSDASATSTFEKMIQVAFTHSSVETFTKDLKDTEKLIKKEFEVGSMPGPWRSAKSVIHSAMKLGIGLVDDNGGFYGKTFLQNKIKESKTDTKEPETSEEYGNRVIKMLMAVPEGIDAVAVVKQVKDFLKVVD